MKQPVCGPLNRSQLKRSIPNAPCRRWPHRELGSLVVRYCGEEKLVHVCDGEAGKLLYKLGPLTEDIADVVLAPDASLVAILGTSGTVRLRPAGDGRDIGSQNTGGELINGAFDAQGHKLAVTSSDGMTKIWTMDEARSGAWSATPVILSAPGDRMPRLAFSHSDDKILTLSGDRTGRLWDAETGRLLLTFTDPEHQTKETEDFALGCAYSPDGRHIATDAFGELEIWDAATGKRLSTSQTTLGVPKMALAFSGDSRRIVTAGQEWDARIAEVPSGRTMKVSDFRAIEPFAYDTANEVLVLTEASDADLGVRVYDAMTMRRVA